MTANRPIYVYDAAFPAFLGYVFVALICFPALGDLPGGMSIAHGVMFASIPFWFTAASTRNALVLDPGAAFGVAIILACITFLTLWAFLSVMDIGSPIRAGRMIVTLVAGLSIFFMFVGTLTTARIDTFVRVLCAALALTCLLSVIAYFVPALNGIIFNGTDRASGFFKNPNQFGMAISTVVPVAAAALLGQRERRWRWLACVLLLLLGLALSGSKTNLAISSATLVFLFWAYAVVGFSGWARMRMMVVSLFGAVALVIGNITLLWYFNPRALNLLRDMVSRDAEIRSFSTREELWHLSIAQFHDDPIFGRGAGQPLEASYADQLVTHSHNLLLDYLRTIGAPGFGVLLILLLTVLVLSMTSMLAAANARNAPLRHRMLCIGLATSPVAYIGANFSSDSMGPSTSPFFWTVVFLGLSSRLLLRSGRRDTFRPDPAPAPDPHLVTQVGIDPADRQAVRRKFPVSPAP